MFKKYLQKNKNKKSGFTILIAVITAGILLIVAMSIGSIALKEQLLSTANKESQVAFYAADTGMECALFWDQKEGAFVLDPNNNPATSLSNFICNDDTDSTHKPVLSGPSGSSPIEYSYSFEVAGIPVEGSTQNTTCAIVTVTKDTNDSRSVNGKVDLTKTYTTINSYGYNTCGASLGRLERGIVGTY